MEIGIVVYLEKSGDVVFSNTETNKINEVLFKSNPNNALKVGYIFEFRHQKYEIQYITLPEVVVEKVNGVNGFLKIYVSKIG